MHSNPEPRAASPAVLEITRILVPLDLDAGPDPALAVAYAIAKQHGAELDLLHVLTKLEPTLYDTEGDALRFEEVRHRLEAEAEAQLRAAASGVVGRGVVVHTALRRSLALVDAILTFVYEQQIDLVVIHTHGRRGVDHFLLGSVAEEIVHRAPCPILTMRGAGEADARPGRIDRILVPMDFSESSVQALQQARALAAAYGAPLDVLHVIGTAPLPVFWIGGTGTIYDLLPTARSAARERLEHLLAESPGPDVSAEVHVAEGTPVAEILKFAERQQSNLIVMATRGLSGARHFLLGSVAERVVRAAPCPVWTVRTSGHGWKIGSPP